MRPKERTMLDDNHQVRLFSVAGVKGQQEAEQRATAALLSVLTMVRTLSRRLLGPLGASKADRAAVEACTEVPYKTADGETPRSDGVIRVSSGKHAFTALVEVKTGDSPQELSQIEKYLKLARAEGYACLITISGEVAPSTAHIRRHGRIHCASARSSSITSRGHGFSQKRCSGSPITASTTRNRLGSPQSSSATWSIPTAASLRPATWVCTESVCGTRRVTGCSASQALRR